MKKVLIVGFGGIGSKIADIFSKNGWNVSIFCRKNTKSGGCVDFYRVDLRQKDQIQEAFKALEQKAQSLDVIINSVGITQDRLAVTMKTVEWDEVVDVNLAASFRITKWGQKLLEKNGGGHLIHLGSIVGTRGQKGQSNYAAAKAGLVGLVKSTAKELGAQNIRVNVVLPGFLETPMTASIPEEQRAEIRQENVLGRIGSCEEVARFVYFLCTTEHISGQVFNLDSRILPT